MTTSARGSARERGGGGRDRRRERRNVAASARSELQLSPSGRGSERSRVKAVKGREKEKRAGGESYTAEKRDNVREKGESTLTSTRAARGGSLDFYHLGRLIKGMEVS